MIGKHWTTVVEGSTQMLPTLLESMLSCELYPTILHKRPMSMFISVIDALGGGVMF